MLKFSLPPSMSPPFHAPSIGLVLAVVPSIGIGNGAKYWYWSGSQVFILALVGMPSIGIGIGRGVK